MLGNSIKKFALNQAFNYIEKDPIKNLTHVMDMVDKFAGSGPQSFPRQRQAIRDAINNEDSVRALLKNPKNFPPCSAPKASRIKC